MGADSFDVTKDNGNDFSNSNFSLGMAPEDQLSCMEGMAGTGSEHIVVAVRVRPLSSAEVAEGKRSCCDVLNGNTVVIKKSADPSAYLRSQKVCTVLYCIMVGVVRFTIILQTVCITGSRKCRTNGYDLR